MLKKVLLSLTIVVVGLSIFSYYGSLSRPEISVEQLRKDILQANQEEKDLVENAVETLARRAERRKDQRIDILLLSGGGQHGAYGVGFLRGWNANPKTPMPKFDIVTGISTGALQAPFALMGSKTSLEKATKLYLNAATDLAPGVDWFFWLKRTGGVLNTTLYRKAIGEAINDQFKSELLKEFQQDRQLFFGTADFDTGTGRTWNLAQVLSQSEDSLQRAQTLLLAATSIPGIFPSQIINGHIHSDGGVVSNILPIFNLEAYQRLSQKLKKLGIQKPVTIHMWIVMNFWTHPRFENLSPANFNTMQSRGNSYLFTLAQPLALQRLQDLAAAVSSGVPGLKMEVKMTAIPVDMANEPESRELFNKDWMKKLEALGYQRAQGDQAWDAIPSAYERPITNVY